MPPTEKQRERRGLFGRKKKKERVDADTSYNTKSDGDSLSSGRSKDDRKRKGGLGQKIRRLVGGRKKSKRTGDEVSTVEVYDPNVRTPQQGLDPDLLANVLSRDETNPSQDPHIVAGRFGAIDEAGEEEEDEEDDDEEEERTMDSGEMLYGADGERDDISEQGELVGPLEIVLVLVDPQSLRFELLQLEFETPQLSRVSECLEQVEDIVTETALKSLEFHSVLDRQGNSFPAKVSLGKALTCRRRGKDILVGISKDVTPDEAGRLARPILGDAKVIQMLEMNGYRVRGWAKDAKEQSELKDSQKDRFIVAERKRQVRITTILLGLALISYILSRLYSIFFGISPIHLLGDMVRDRTQLFSLS